MLLKLILVDLLADLPPKKLPASCHVLQFYISCYYEGSYWQIKWQIYSPRKLAASTMKVHIGRSTPQKINCQLVVMNGNFKFLNTMKAHIGRSTGRSTPPPGKLLLSCQEWHFHMSCYYLSSDWKINWQIYPPPQETAI